MAKRLQRIPRGQISEPALLFSPLITSRSLTSPTHTQSFSSLPSPYSSDRANATGRSTMASGSIPAAAPSLSRSPSSSSSSSLAPQPCSDRFTRLSFPLALQTKPLASIKGGRGACNGEAFVRKAQLNEIVGEVSNDMAVVIAKDEDVGKEAPLPPVELSPQAISEFMNQVSSLVKLVDSKDVVELQLKQPGCELIIRKKEALPQPPAQQVVMVPSHAPPPVATPSYSAPPPPAAPSQPVAALPAPATGPQSPKSSHPPLKSPMAGTFYRSPAPGQPAFVKPGDKVKKGQVLCIIEAMKLMNEIEADHAGTVVEILAEDGKPVGVDQPLFVIEA